MNDLLPRMALVRQRFPKSPPIDIQARVQQGFEKVAFAKGLKPGCRIAVAVGSRGISNLQLIVSQVVKCLQAAGAAPFIIPAMGSHGGATPEGQTELLRGYGVSEENLGVPIRASLQVKAVGATPEGLEVLVSAEALGADGIVLINRVKPHTDFSGTLGSGIIKMLVIGLGKQRGASNFHVAASTRGYEPVLRGAARVILSQAPILGAIAIIENQYHETAGIQVWDAGEIESRENIAFLESKNLMPTLPLEDIDILILDRIGKNISGSGMDPNIIGRGVHGYSSSLAEKTSLRPHIKRIFVRELTEESHGNGVGIGLADFTTARFVGRFNPRISYMNALTALTPQSVKLPIYFDSDKEVLAHLLPSLGSMEARRAKMVRIRDTLSLDWLEVSEACLPSLEAKPEIEVVNPSAPIQFDQEGNLAEIPTGQGDP